MQYEVHIFLGTALIGKGHNSDHPIGEKHAILFFMRENVSSEFNLDRAIRVVRSCKLNKPEFTRIGKVDPNRVNEKHRECYEKALDSGSALVLYTDPI